MESNENRLENAIRANLANQQTEVQSIEMTEGEDGNMTGFAMVREASGRSGRLNCNAHREGDNYNFRCSPAIDEAVLTEMEGLIRRELEQQAEVIEVDMQRHNDDNHMRGHVVVGDGAGNRARLACTATRDATNIGTFNWQCAPEGAAAGAGNAGGASGSGAAAGGGKTPAGGQGGAAPGGKPAGGEDGGEGGE
ncbi:MAG TPA: hypothetical protein VF552_08140 [Allosphingosinicella sp.]